MVSRSVIGLAGRGKNSRQSNQRVFLSELEQEVVTFYSNRTGVALARYSWQLVS